MPRRVKITGERGRWLAEAEGVWLPVIHSSWRQGATGYHDPMTGAAVTGKRHAEYVEALRSRNLVIVQRDRPGSLDRDGYVGIFTFKDLIIGEDGSIRLTLVSRHADPAT